MRSGVIIIGKRKENRMYIEKIQYPDGRKIDVDIFSFYGEHWFGGVICNCYSVTLDDSKLFLYEHRGFWIADDEKPEWIDKYVRPD
jgi:hypothetical protein